MAKPTVPRIALLLAAGLGLAVLLPATLSFGLGGQPVTERVSVSSLVVEASAASPWSSVNDDGRIVAFASDASNLVAGDSNFARDIFLHDRTTGLTELVSVSSSGTQGDAASGGISAGPPRLSDDGRYVAFASLAGNLVDDDTNGVRDIFVRDRVSGTTERVSVDSSGPLDSGAVEGNNESLGPSISGDGRYVTFSSRADNLLAEDDNNGTWDVFLHDRQAGTTELVSSALDGGVGDGSSGFLGAGPGRISADGRYVSFGSIAGDLVADDGNGDDDVFVRDRQSGTTERVSVSTVGLEGNDHSMYGDISDNGRYVVFFSFADNLVSDDGNEVADVFLHDRDAGTTIRMSAGTSGEGNGRSTFPAISGNGRFAIFQSEASNLVPPDGNGVEDILCFDVVQGTLLRVSMTDGGLEPDGGSSFADISADGNAVVYRSDATNLAPDDSNDATDVFVWGKPLRPPDTPMPTNESTATPTATPTSEPTTTPTATPTPCVPDGLGDANDDGIADSRDALFVLQFVADLLTSLPNPEKADVNQDGQITAIDAFLMLQFTAGLVPCLPPLP